MLTIAGGIVLAVIAIILLIAVINWLFIGGAFFFAMFRKSPQRGPQLPSAGPSNMYGPIDDAERKRVNAQVRMRIDAERLRQI